MNGITDQAPYTGPASTASLAADANPGMAVSDLTTAVTGDGTYELRVRCMDNMDWSTAPDSVVPGDPFWSQRITVTGDTWVVGEGAEATSVTATASDPAPEPGESTTLTATVTPAEAAGTVTFTEAGTTLGQAPVTNGKAEYATSTLARGTHSIVARFTPSDSAKYGASESTPLTVRVDPPDFELLDATGTRLPLEPALQRGQTVKLVVRGCEPDKAFTMAMGGSDATFPGATSDADGVVTWPALTVPDDAVGGRSKWDFQPGCAGLSAGGVTVLFTVPEPSTSPSSSPTGDPTDDPTDDPSDDPTDAPTDDPTDDPAGDTSGTTSGTVSGTTSGTTAGDGGTGGTSPQGGGLASTGSQVALFSGVGAVVLFAAGVAFVRFGRRNGLLSFGEPRA
ncbi:Ig-like domain-containing protein [Streptomyces phaeoluteigriseus]